VRRRESTRRPGGGAESGCEYRRLLAWARRFDERQWAVENADGLDRHLAQWLLTRGEIVLATYIGIGRCPCRSVTRALIGSLTRSAVDSDAGSERSDKSGWRRSFIATSGLCPHQPYRIFGGHHAETRSFCWSSGSREGAHGLDRDLRSGNDRARLVLMLSR
jgi:hypothetical protein